MSGLKRQTPWMMVASQFLFSTIHVVTFSRDGERNMRHWTPFNILKGMLLLHVLSLPLSTAPETWRTIEKEDGGHRV